MTPLPELSDSAEKILVWLADQPVKLIAGWNGRQLSNAAINAGIAESGDVVAAALSELAYAGYVTWKLESSCGVRR